MTSVGTLRTTGSPNCRSGFMTTSWISVTGRSSSTTLSASLNCAARGRGGGAPRRPPPPPRAPRPPPARPPRPPPPRHPPPPPPPPPPRPPARPRLIPPNPAEFWGWAFFPDPPRGFGGGGGVPA